MQQQCKPQELIGREVAFTVFIPRKISGRPRPLIESHIGRVKEVHNSVVIIEGSRGGLYSRTVDKIAILEKREK